MFHKQLIFERCKDQRQTVSSAPQAPNRDYPAPVDPEPFDAGPVV